MALTIWTSVSKVMSLLLMRCLGLLCVESSLVLSEESVCYDLCVLLAELC